VPELSHESVEVSKLGQLGSSDKLQLQSDEILSGDLSGVCPDNDDMSAPQGRLQRTRDEILSGDLSGITCSLLACWHTTVSSRTVPQPTSLSVLPD
jgi:hypothetical protein